MKAMYIFALYIGLQRGELANVTIRVCVIPSLVISQPYCKLLSCDKRLTIRRIALGMFMPMGTHRSRDWGLGVKTPSTMTGDIDEESDRGLPAPNADFSAGSLRREVRRRRSMAEVHSDLSVLYEEDRELWRVLMMMITCTWHLDDKVEALRAQLNDKHVDALLHSLQYRLHTTLPHSRPGQTPLGHRGNADARTSPTEDLVRRDVTDYPQDNYVSFHQPNSLPTGHAPHEIGGKLEPLPLEEYTHSLRRPEHQSSKLGVLHPGNLGEHQSTDLDLQHHVQVHNDYDETRDVHSYRPRIDEMGTAQGGVHTSRAQRKETERKTARDTGRAKPSRQTVATVSSTYTDVLSAHTPVGRIGTSRQSGHAQAAIYPPKGKCDTGYVNHGFSTFENEIELGTYQASVTNSCTQTDAVIMARNRARYDDQTNHHHNQPATKSRKTVLWCCFS